MTNPDPSGTVDSDGFRAAMASTVEVMRKLTSAVNNVAPRHGNQVSVPSKALDEIALEAKEFGSKSDWSGPIQDTHSFGGITLMAATDYVRTFAETFDAAFTPIYGHLVVARSALESSVVSAWLNDPDIGTVDRVKRGLCEQLYSARELVRLNIEDDPQARVEHWEAVSRAFGWEPRYENGRPIVNGSKRPSVPAGIEKLLVGEGEWRIGRVQWSYLSSVSHVTWYGLRQSVVEPPAAPGVTGLSLAGVGTTLQSVYAQAVCLVRALRRAADARFKLMGWQDAEWITAKSDAADYEVELIKSFEAGQANG